MASRAINSSSKKASHVAIEVNGNTTGVDDHHEDQVHSFAIDPRALSDLAREKKLESLSQLPGAGGVTQVAAALKTDVQNGISGSEADLENRRLYFGTNEYKNLPTKSFASFVFEGLKSLTAIVLLVLAFISTGASIYENGLEHGWFGGATNIFAVLFLVVISAASKFCLSRQLQKLSYYERRNSKVLVVRDGKRNFVSAFDVVVGDVVHLKIGDRVPADGLFLGDVPINLDYEFSQAAAGGSNIVEVNASGNPFLFFGSKVVHGNGYMLVTSVGMNTAWAETMSGSRWSLNNINSNLEEQIPIQASFDSLVSYSGKVGLAVAMVVFLVLLFISEKEKKLGDMIKTILSFINAAVAVVEFAVPEGLPLAVNLTLSYSLKQMMKDNAIVRKLSAIGKLSSVTATCADKSCLLDLNQTEVAELWIGKEAIGDLTSIAPEVLSLLKEGAILSSTAAVKALIPSAASNPIFVGPTEEAIISWAISDLGVIFTEEIENSDAMHVESFKSEAKLIGVSLRKSNEKAVHTHWKGDAEFIFNMCTQYYDQKGALKSINEEETMQLRDIIQSLTSRSFDCIAFAYKKVADFEGQVSHMLEENELILLGFVRLKNPCQPGVTEAVELCKKAGISVKVLTGDSLEKSKAIATECGVLSLEEDTNDIAVVESAHFDDYSREERMSRVDDIQVMARSSPHGKRLMVQCLKEKGHVVAITGDDPDDATSLKEADVGFSMGIQVPEEVKESSDIIVMENNNNFVSVVTTLRWGRCIFNNIQKFVEFQLTVNIAAFVINFVAVVSSSQAPLSAVQILWINIIVDTLGVLALVTDHPTKDLIMAKPPANGSNPLIVNIMWKNLLAQTLYQIVVLLRVLFKGTSVLGLKDNIKGTVIFNTFVLCQVFNVLNARAREKKNIFEGLCKKKLFLVIAIALVACQVVMVELLNKAASTKRLSWKQWLACIAIAAFSWVVGFLVKCT